MAFDDTLAKRISEYFQFNPDVVEKKMFGGLCFMVKDHMCCGIVGETLMARVGPKQYEECLAQPHAKEMDFTGKAMKGMVYVSPEGISSDEDLAHWISYCENFVNSLPPKKPKSKKAK